MNKKTSFIVNSCLLIFSICLVLAAFELILPLLHIETVEDSVYEVRRPVVQAQYGAYHPQLSYTLEKNLRNIRLYYPGRMDYTINTNSQGFRGGEWDLSENRRNIMLLGDSYAFGWGVQWRQTSGEQLEHRLQQVDKQFQVINLGQSGYSIKQVVQAFEYYHEQLQPEAVVYIVCQNDLESMVAADFAGDFQLEPQPSPEAEKEFQEFIRRNQPEYWTWDKLRRKSYLHGFYARIVRPIISKRIRNSLTYPEEYGDADFSPPLKTVFPAPDSPQKQFMMFCLARIRSQFEGPFVLIPTSDRSLLLKKDSPQSLRWILNEFARQHENTYFVDFESVMRKTPDGLQYWIATDDHWSAAGHAKAAELIFPVLTEGLHSDD